MTRSGRESRISTGTLKDGKSAIGGEGDAIEQEEEKRNAGSSGQGGRKKVAGSIAGGERTDRYERRKKETEERGSVSCYEIMHRKERGDYCVGNAAITLFAASEKNAPGD